LHSQLLLQLHQDKVIIPQVVEGESGEVTKKRRTKQAFHLLKIFYHPDQVRKRARYLDQIQHSVIFSAAMNDQMDTLLMKLEDYATRKSAALSAVWNQRVNPDREGAKTR